MLKVAVKNNISVMSGLLIEIDRMREKKKQQEFGRLNLLPRTNPIPNLNELSEAMFILSTTHYDFRMYKLINMTHFITNIQKHPSKKYSKCCSLTALNMYIILLSLNAPDYQL